jgi:hypothetical protein
MPGAISPLPQYAFMAWCSVRKAQGQLYLYLFYGYETCSPHGRGRGVYKVLVGSPKWKRPLGRPRCRWEDNIKMDLREIETNGVNWIQLAQDMVQWQASVNMVMNLQVP